MEQGTVQNIRKRLYAMRNGALADSLRAAGMPYRMIFGLNLPQITAIARDFSRDARLATELWNSGLTRECMLLAPMLYPVEDVDDVMARKWIAEVPTPEVADILCMKLLRYYSGAYQLAVSLLGSESDIVRYTALRLIFNLLPAHIDEVEAAALAEQKRDVPLTRMLAHSMLDEISFLREG